ncbi:helix-turn-helix domain-containing protein [Streptomyces sp. NPDC052114]|uniref:TetR/AcrR family transcriptional regulator n=1 Tax=unclassified Streptomyces TaxID=2593676 RepID=UPI003449AD98
MTQARRGRPSTGVREAVLKSTVEVLGEAGIALSTKEIARRAGVAESSIFYHFGDRLGLLQAVIGQHLPVFSDATVVLGRREPDGDAAPEGDAASAGAGEDLRSDLVAVVSGLERFYLGIMPILGTLQSDRQLRELLVGREGAVGPHLAHGVVADLLRTEQGAGRVRAGLDPAAGALLLIGAAHQRAMHRYLLGSGAEAFLPPVDTVVDALLPSFA